MLKKFLIVLLTCVCFSLSISSNTLGYRDVTIDKWYYEDVTLAKNEGILEGKSETEFCPTESLKISEAIAVVSRLHAKLNGKVIFSEWINDWYTPYLNYAISNDIIGKNGFKDFERDISREEFAHLCYKIVKNNNSFINSIEAIPDLDKTNESYTEVEMLYNLGIIVGTDEYGSFLPNACITRAEITAIVNRIIYPERRIKKEFMTIESIRYEKFKDKVLKDVSNSKEIFVSCDKQVVSQENLDKLQAEINKYKGVCGFYLVTLDGKFSIGYNIDQALPSASTVKAPFALYSMKQIENGNGTLQEEQVYQAKHYCEGSGIIQYEKFNTKYTLEDVFYYTINISDNIGYYMLQDRFGIAGYNDFLEKIGCSKMKLLWGAKWGEVYPREAALIWNEIYNYSQTSEYGKKLFDLFVNAEYNFIKQAYLTKYNDLNYKIAHKSGFNPDGRHDEAIILSDTTPYFITIVTKTMGDRSERTYFNNTALILESIMHEYDSKIAK